MSVGKNVAQAGHAFTQIALDCSSKDSTLFNLYQQGSFGTKIVLFCPSTEQLLIAQYRAIHLNLFNFLVQDSGDLHFFNGQPTITAFAFGPTTKLIASKVLRGLNSKLTTTEGK